MRSLFITALLVFIFFVNARAQTSPAEEIAAKMANRIKDSLGLADSLKVKIFYINMLLHDQKSRAWRDYSDSDSLITIHCQRIENTRDSLYHTVLPEDKFLLYTSKKRNLVTNN